MRAQEFTKHINKSRIFENTSQLPPNVIELIKKIAQSTAAPDHKKAMINALMAKHRDKQGFIESNRQQINDYDTWSDQVAAQGGEIYPQKDRVRMVAQSWDGETIGEFNLRTGQGWINDQQGVAEGQDDNGISFQVQKGKNKFATTLSIGNKPVGVYQYDADTGRSIAEVYPEFKGKGLGKLLVLHAIYTAAQLGLDFQEDESRTAEYDNVLDSLSSNGYIVDDDGYWYVTGEGEQYLQQSMKQGVAETTGDPKFDKMLKGITGKRQVAKQQKADTKQQARDAFGGMFGGNPADKLSIRKKGVAEGLPPMGFVRSEIKRDPLKNPTRTYIEISKMLGIASRQLQGLVRSFPGFPAPIKDIGRQARRGNHNYYELNQVKQWIKNNNLKDTIAAIANKNIAKDQGMTEDSDDFEVRLDGKTVPGPFNDFDHARNKASKLISYQKGEVAEVYVNGKLKMRLKLNTSHQHFDEHTAA